MDKEKIRERLVELFIKADKFNKEICDSFIHCGVCSYAQYGDCAARIFADYFIASGVTVQECARPLEEWHEDYGDVLWWRFPIEEPPYVGSPLDLRWTGYHTHWTPIALPEPPKEVE